MTDEPETLPTFLVIGAAKTGTNSLYHYLGAHPDVFVTENKEPMFFTLEWHRGLDWYRSLYEEGRTAIARGEASVNYASTSVHPEAPERIRSVVPDVKLIYIVRHPIERIRSHYAFMRSWKNDRRSLEQMLRDSPAVVSGSLYARNIDLYLEHFRRDQLLVITSEALREDRLATVREVLRFIGVEGEPRQEDLEREYLTVEMMSQLDPWAERAMHRAGRTPLRFLPGGLRRGIRRTFERRVRHPEVSAALERELWEAFRPDLVRLRELCPGLELWDAPDA